MKVLNLMKVVSGVVLCAMAVSSLAHIGDCYWELLESGLEKISDYILEKIG